MTDLRSEVGNFLDEWQRSIEAGSEAIKRKDSGFLRDTVILRGLKSANYVNYKGSEHLDNAATLLLRKEKLGLKVTTETARQALIDALSAHLPKALKNEGLSEDAIIAGAAKRVRDSKRYSGNYVFPMVFAPRVKTSDFRIGPARIVSKDVFQTENEATLRGFAEGEGSDIEKRLLSDWQIFTEKYDHFITVEVGEFEEKMGWPAARDAAELCLNLIRMLFGYSHTKEIRIGGGFIWETVQSRLIIKTGGEPWLSSSYGPHGTHLNEDWGDILDQQMGQFKTLLNSAVCWFVSGTHQGDPILERLRYAHRLIAEAYREPEEPMRLVRMTSALEAIAVIGGADKAHNLAVRCAAAGGWGDYEAYCTIYDRVAEAYTWRNAIVHGDAPNEIDMRRAFFRLEKHLLHIVLGFMALFAGIAHGVKPQSVRQLRRAVTDRIDLFFLAPELVT